MVSVITFVVIFNFYGTLAQSAWREDGRAVQAFTEVGTVAEAAALL
jgi:hypothetical protein